MIDPISIAFGAAQAGLGLLGAAAEGAAARQDHVNQVAFQNANTTFARWQAGFNARVADANAQYNYWQETVNYNQNLAYTNGLRNMELIKAARQAEIVGQTRAAAGSAYVRDAEALSQAIAEASMQDAVAMQQYQWRALQTRASVMAMTQEGRSVDRIVNDFARQQGDFETLQAINQRLQQRQYTREQAGQVAQYLSRWNSQQFYEEQPYIDPVAPFTPLPTLLQPPPPSMTGSGPSGAATALNIGSALLGGVRSAFSMQSTIRGLKTPDSPKGSGTGD